MFFSMEQRATLDEASVYHSIAKLPLLSHSEVARLTLQYRNGDRRAFETLVYSNVKLVISIAKKLFQPTRSYTLDDVVDIGITGLIRALDDYDPSVSKFSTYATYWVKQKIRRTYHNEGVIRIPADTRFRLHALEEEYTLFCQRQRAEISLQFFICQRPQFDLEQRALKALRPFSLDQEYSNGTERTTKLYEHIPNRSPPPTVSGIPSFEDMISHLSPREQFVMSNLFYHGESAQTIADLLACREGRQVSRQRVRQIELGACKKLRKTLRAYRDAI